MLPLALSSLPSPRATKSEDPQTIWQLVTQWIRWSNMEQRTITLPAEMWIDIGEQTSGWCTGPVWTLVSPYHKNRDPRYMPMVRQLGFEAWIWKAKRQLDSSKLFKEMLKQAKRLHSFITDIHTICMYLCQLSTAPRLMFAVKRVEWWHLDWQGHYIQ